MNVLQLHGTDTDKGGGPIAMLRLQEWVRQAGHHSRILCMNPTRPDSVGIERTGLERRLRSITARLKLNDLECLASFRIGQMSAFQQADVLHIHCLHGGFFNYLALPLLAKNKPAVYTLHDMWPFTGHCANSVDCERWKTGCGGCPYPDAYPSLPRVAFPLFRDSTHLEWKLKRWSYRRAKVTIIAPSRWMARCAKESILGNLPILHIPHGIDTETYRPLDRVSSREALGIPAHKRVVLFVAAKLDSSHPLGHGKGPDLFIAAIQRLPDSVKRELVVVLMGRGGEAIQEGVGVPAVNVGYVTEDKEKAVVFSAADLLVSATRGDNFPLVLVESLACGTPIVSFNVGGVSDLVRPGVTGYLAQPGNPDDLSFGITAVLKEESTLARMRHECRAIAEREYGRHLYVQRHVALYQEQIEAHRSCLRLPSVKPLSQRIS